MGVAGFLGRQVAGGAEHNGLCPGDQQGCDLIVASLLMGEGLGLGVVNRLGGAAGPRTLAWEDPRGVGQGVVVVVSRPWVATSWALPSASR